MICYPQSDTSAMQIVFYLSFSAVSFSLDIEMFVLPLLLAFCGEFKSFLADDEIVPIDIARFGTEIYGKPIAFNERDYRRKSGNPEERGPYLEGDLLIPYKSKNGISSQAYRWPNKQIPYEISGKFSELQVCK